MRALIPDDRGGVRFADVAEPEPGPGEVLVEVEAFSVNRGETLLLDRPRPGWRPGKDVAGTVVRGTEGGPGAGTRVVAHPQAEGWAERVRVPLDAVAALPDEVDAATAAALPLAGITGLGLVLAAGPLAGRRLLVTGASGGVGHYVTELAVAQGALVTAVSRRGARLAELGADVVTAVDDATGPFDVVLESVGGTGFTAALSRMADHGTLIWFGQASLTPVTLDMLDFTLWPHDAHIRRFTHEPPARPFAEDLATLVRLVAADVLHPEVGVLRDWADTGAVLTDLRERRVTGNAVLTVPRG